MKMNFKKMMASLAIVAGLGFGMGTAQSASAVAGSMTLGPYGLVMLGQAWGMMVMAMAMPVAAPGLIAGAMGLDADAHAVGNDLAQVQFANDLDAKVSDGIYSEQEKAAILKDLAKIPAGATAQVDLREGKDVTVNKLITTFEIDPLTADYLATVLGL